MSCLEVAEIFQENDSFFKDCINKGVVPVRIIMLNGERALKKFGNCSIAFSDGFLHTVGEDEEEEEEIVVSGRISSLFKKLYLTKEFFSMRFSN